MRANSQPNILALEADALEVVVGDLIRDLRVFERGKKAFKVGEGKGAFEWGKDAFNEGKSAFDEGKSAFDEGKGEEVKKAWSA